MRQGPDLWGGHAASQESTLREADDGVAGHDQVVQNPNVHECERLTDAAGDQFVGLGGVWGGL